MQMADFKPFGAALPGRLGGVARDVLGQMEQCHNARLGDDGPAAFRKLRVKFFLELGMVLARGTAKVAEAARSKIRRYGGAAGGGHPPAVVHGDGAPLMEAANALGWDYEGYDMEVDLNNGNEAEIHLKTM